MFTCLIGIFVSPAKICEDDVHLYFVSPTWTSQDDVYLYGVFDGHDSANASQFAAQRLPAELLLGQLSGKTTDAEVKEVLYQVEAVKFAIWPSQLNFCLCLQSRSCQNLHACIYKSKIRASPI